MREKRKHTLCGGPVGRPRTVKVLDLDDNNTCRVYVNFYRQTKVGFNSVQLNGETGYYVGMKMATQTGQFLYDTGPVALILPCGKPSKRKMALAKTIAQAFTPEKQEE